MSIHLQVVSSDVLVIGGGGAAVMSAIEASKSGSSVVLVTKGKVGKSGNTIMIGGGFSIDGESAREMCGEPEANPAYTREKLLQKLVTSGFYLGDEALQRLFVEEGGPAVRECLAWAKHAGQYFEFIPQSSSWRTSGASFGKTVRQGLKQHPSVRVSEDIWIAALLKHGDAVCGALGVDINTGDLIRYHARAVILATGGFQPFSLKNTHADMSGDGIGLALRAGAGAVDMEFLLFIGTIVEPAYARGSIIPFLITMPALFKLRPTVTDLDGRELSFPPGDRYVVGPTSGKVNKLLMTEFYGRGVFEKYKAHGNAFYYDYSAYSEEEIREAFAGFADFEHKWHRAGWYNGIDLARLTEDILRNGKRLKVGFGNEYSMGGVMVDTGFSAGVPGLYAAGEVTGGTFGAFRSGDGLTEMLVHGRIAGSSAAAYARTHPQLIPQNIEEVVAETEAPLRKSGNPSGISATLLRGELERICDEGFNFYRSGERLQKAYTEIVKLRKSLPSLSVATTDRRYNLEWMDAFAVKNLVLCAETGIYAALHRRESRGTHLRTDHPEVNNREFLMSFTAKLGSDGAPVYGTKRPEAVHLTLDTEMYPTVADFLAVKVLGQA